MDKFEHLNALFLNDYVDILHRRQKVIVEFFLAVVLVVGLGSFLMTPVYRATVTLLIDEESPNVLTTSGNVSLQAPDYLSYKEYYQSQIEILTSNSLARKIFDDFNLGNSKDYANAKEPVKSFLKSVKVEPVRDTRLAKLYVDNKDPVLAAQIANRMADLFVKRNLYYISRNELMNLFKNEYLKLESKSDEYSKVYKDKHPAMIDLRSQMADLVKKIGRVKETNLDYTLLEQDIQVSGQYSIAALKANNISVQDPAQVPRVPLRPNKRLNIMLGLIVGLLGGIGLALFLDYNDRTIKDVEDIERIADWPFLGKVPAIRGPNKELNVKFKGNDAITESYRAIRTRLLFSDTKERPLKTIVISSLGAQEGKTMTTCNLATAIAQNNKKVLLVDADMRKPRIAGIFNKKTGKGLSQFLSGQAAYDEVIQQSDIENLSLAADKHSAGNSTELLHSDKMKEFINSAKKNFDIVIFDSPPLGIITDAIILGSQTDGIILVVESGKTPQKAVVRNDKLLNKAKINVIGVVINKVLTSGTESYYYSKSYSDANR